MLQSGAGRCFRTLHEAYRPTYDQTRKLIHTSGDASVEASVHLQRSWQKRALCRDSLLAGGPNRRTARGLGFSQRLRRSKAFQVRSQAGANAAPLGESAPGGSRDRGQDSLAAVLLGALKGISAYLPQVIIASTLLALVYPPSFAWFTSKYYAPTLGFLMFSVGMNVTLGDFRHALERPGALALGYFGQFVVKPLLGLLMALTVVPLLGLPDAVGSGVLLMACVSGAQLSNYATFLVEPSMAPLSIVMTATSTASAVVVTPALTLLLLGTRLPVDAVAMVSSIAQIVVVPVAAGLLLNRFAASLSRTVIKPALPALSVLSTALCIGSPLAVNAALVRSALGAKVILPVVLLHAAAFALGYALSASVFKGDVHMSRTISLETGMQSSLLSLALANRFFPDPLVGIPSAISVIVMSLMGFGLVMYWNGHHATASE